MSWLSPTTWLLYGGLVLALIAGGWRVHHVIDQGGYDRAQAEYTAIALKASEQARAKEAELSTKVQGVANAYQAEKKKRAADAVAAADALGLLKSALAAADERENSAAAGRVDADPRDGIVAECASALVEVDRVAQGLASQVTGLQGFARDVCVTP